MPNRQEYAEMRKAELEKLASDAAVAVGSMLRATRRAEGPCCYCGSEEGKQHSKNCPAWPLVLWRQRYNDARAKDQPERMDMSTIWAKRL